MIGSTCITKSLIQLIRHDFTTGYFENTSYITAPFPNNPITPRKRLVERLNVLYIVALHPYSSFAASGQVLHLLLCMRRARLLRLTLQLLVMIVNFGAQIRELSAHLGNLPHERGDRIFRILKLKALLCKEVVVGPVVVADVLVQGLHLLLGLLIKILDVFTEELDVVVRSLSVLVGCLGIEQVRDKLLEASLIFSTLRRRTLSRSSRDSCV